MKKLLFTANTLDVGGIETALVNLLNELIKKHNITLVLEKKQGVFLKRLNSQIKIIEYKPSANKIFIIRKIINIAKRIKFIIKYKNKFDFSASFATYSKMGSFCARTASENNALWIHSNYIEFYNNNIDEMKEFFRFIEYNKFKNYIFVSENSKQAFIKVYPEIQEKSIIIHNLIDYKNILDKSNEKIEIKREDVPTFLNVARHDEHSKRLTRLIEAAEKLKNDGIDFRIILIGNGPDNKKYQELIKKNNLEKYFLLLGEKENPYPYFRIADAVVLTSDHEGYPVVFDEARVLNVPIITTDVSDAKKDIDKKYGIVTNKDSQSIYIALKEFMENGFIIKDRFDMEKYNLQILDQLKNFF